MGSQNLRNPHAFGGENARTSCSSSKLKFSMLFMLDNSWQPSTDSAWFYDMTQARGCLLNCGCLWRKKLLDLYVRSAAIATHTLCICIAAWDFLTKRGINYSWKQQLRLSFLLQCAVKSVLVSLFHRKHHLVRRFFSSDKWRVLALKICPLIISLWWLTLTHFTITEFY